MWHQRLEQTKTSVGLALICLTMVACGGGTVASSSSESQSASRPNGGESIDATISSGENVIEAPVAVNPASVDVPASIDSTQTESVSTDSLPTDSLLTKPAPIIVPVESAPVVPAPAEVGTTDPSTQAPVSSCDAIDVLPTFHASDFGGNDGNGPENAIDNDLTTRWSTLGTGKSLTIDMGAIATVTTLELAWHLGDTRSAYFDVQTSLDTETWVTVLQGGRSFLTLDYEPYTLSESSARYVRVVVRGNSTNEWNSIVEFRANGCVTGVVDTTMTDGPGLDPTLPPSGNFDLLDWTLSVPIDSNVDGKADTLKERELAAGYSNSNFFYTAADGGMVFRCPVNGFKTSVATSYTRVELREMLRRGDTSLSTKGVGGNNWVFGSAPKADRDAAGAVDGILTGTLAVNRVTTTGASNQVGRVVIAQIHANDDEPIRLYYRKLPNNTNGSIYFAHESLTTGTDTYYEMIGSRSSSVSDPVDGIGLNEVFGYEIKIVGNIMTVRIERDNKADLIETVDMSTSGYDIGGQYMYFKAGVYLQDNTGMDEDYAQVTYYSLDNRH